MVDGAFASLELLGEIFLRRVGHVGGDNQLPALLGQLVEAGVEGGEPPIVQRHLGGRFLGEGRDDRLIKHEPVAGVGPAVFQDLVAGDQAGPGPKPAAVVEIGKLPLGDEAHLLHHLVGVLPPRQARPHKRPQLGLVRRKEPQKGVVKFVVHEPSRARRELEEPPRTDLPTGSLPVGRKTYARSRGLAPRGYLGSIPPAAAMRFFGGGGHTLVPLSGNATW